jgi:hypothetical protein
MRYFFDEQGRTRVFAQGVRLYVEGGNPRRTPLIGKIAIYGWKQVKNVPYIQRKKADETASTGRQARLKVYAGQHSQVGCFLLYPKTIRPGILRNLRAQRLLQRGHV